MPTMSPTDPAFIAFAGRFDPELAARLEEEAAAAAARAPRGRPAQPRRDEPATKASCRRACGTLRARLRDYAKLRTALSSSEDAATQRVLVGLPPSTYYTEAVNTLQELVKAEQWGDAEALAAQLMGPLEAAIADATAAQAAESERNAEPPRRSQKKRQEKTKASRKRARVQLERQERTQRVELETGLATDDIGDALDDPAIQEVLVQHWRRVGPETRAFGGDRWLDELLAHTADDMGRRRSRLTDISAALNGARERQTALHVAVTAFVTRTPDPTPNQSQALAKVRTIGAGMLDHVPTGWRVELDTLDKRLPVLVAGDAEQQRLRAEAEAVPAATLETERAAFIDAIAHGSLKGADRTAFFFDVPQRHLTQEAGERLHVAMEAALARAYAIRDAGGSVEDAEAALAHIPPQFWPPPFIRALQGWRKAERELADERVKALVAAGDPAFGSDDGMAVFGATLDLIGLVAVGSDLHGARTDGGKAAIPCAWRGADGFVDLLVGFSEVVRNGYGVKGGLDALRSEEFDLAENESLADLPEIVAKHNEEFAKKASRVAMTALDGTLAVGQAGLNVASNASWALGGIQTSSVFNSKANLDYNASDAISSMTETRGPVPTEAFFLSDFVPVFCMVAAAIDLQSALRKLRDVRKKWRSTKQLMVREGENVVTGRSRDGGALVRAIKNELDARTRQERMTKVDVTGKSLVVAGEVVLVASGGAAGVAGLGLKISGKSVIYANNIVFEGVNWDIARDVKGLIRAAQAGDPVARLTLMEKSGLYAKSYICILAREGNPLAREFIVDRGLTDADIARPHVSIALLREVLLKDADQRDETTVTGAGQVGRALLGEGAVAALGKIGNKGPRPPLEPADYDTALELVPPATEVRVDAAQHEQTWARAREHGLAKPEVSPLSGPVRQAAAACAAAWAAIEPYVDTAAVGPGGWTQWRDHPAAQEQAAIDKHIARAHKRVAAMDAALAGLDPRDARDESHAPTVRYLVRLRVAGSAEHGRLENARLGLGILDEDWTPSASGAVTATGWKENWASAVRACRVAPAPGGGVRKGLAAAEAANKALATGGDARTMRVARVRLAKALQDTAKGLRDAWLESTRFPGLRAYVNDVLEAVLVWSRLNDEALNGGAWAGNPAGADVQGGDGVPVRTMTWRFERASWDSTVSQAVEDGLLPAKRGGANDGGVGAAIEEATAALARHSATEDLADRVAPRVAATAALGRVVDGIESLMRDNRDTHVELKACFAFMRGEALARASTLGDERSSVPFVPEPGFTAPAVEASLQHAEAAGAVRASSRSRSAQKEVVKQLKKLEEKRLRLQGSAAAKDRYERAREAAGILTGALPDALRRLSGCADYSENDAMSDYMDRLGEHAKATLGASDIGGALRGTDVEFPRHPFTWQNKRGWQLVKAEAVAAGLMSGSGKTHFGQAISRYKTARKALKSAKKLGDRAAACERAEASLARVEEIATDLQGRTQNPGLSAYFGSALRHVVEERAMLGRVTQKLNRRQPGV